MERLTFARLLGLSLFAALIGSTIGTALLFWNELSGYPLQAVMGVHVISNASASELLVAPQIWTISLFGTVPGYIAIGAPAIYPFRRVVVRHPIYLAVPVVIYGFVVANVIFGWTLTPGADGRKEYDALWFYSAASAVGFVIALAWWGRRMSRTSG